MSPEPEQLRHKRHARLSKCGAGRNHQGGGSGDDEKRPP